MRIPQKHLKIGAPAGIDRSASISFNLRRLLLNASLLIISETGLRNILYNPAMTNHVSLA
jgi:hypothetical protein